MARRCWCSTDDLTVIQPSGYSSVATFRSVDCVMRICYLPISVLTCRNTTHWYAVGGSVERRCEAKCGHGSRAMTPARSPFDRQHRLDVGLPAWELACHAMPTTVFAAQRPFTLSVSARLGPPQTMSSGTQRARLVWSDPSRARYGHLAAGFGLPGTWPLDRQILRNFHQAVRFEY
jgi:hypothetical protein